MIRCLSDFVGIFRFSGSYQWSPDGKRLALVRDTPSDLVLSGDGGPATAAQLYFPQSVIVDSAGNLFIADQGNNVIRRVDAITKNISTFSADPNFGGALAFMAFDASQSLYVADGGACTVWKLSSTGAATTVAGVAFNCGYNGDNIQATTALLNFAFGIAFDSAGNLYIADSAGFLLGSLSSDLSRWLPT